MTDYALRQMAADDFELIVAHRRAIFIANDLSTLEEIEIAMSHFRDWLLEHMTSETYTGWFALNEAGEVVAGAGVWFVDWPPTSISPQRGRGYVTNVYTEPAYRKQGLAAWLVSQCIEECRRRGYDFVMLHTSVQGRPLYEELGFKPATSEMRLVLAKTGESD
ncbi:MAG: GNAT family N-acetyltransferase [Anaerolineae bacterium]|nr:GNAT family N-acetyltransferase [Anaerolineae bacterium]